MFGVQEFRYILRVPPNGPGTKMLQFKTIDPTVNYFKIIRLKLLWDNFFLKPSLKSWTLMVS